MTRLSNGERHKRIPLYEDYPALHAMSSDSEASCWWGCTTFYLQNIQEERGKNGGLRSDLLEGVTRGDTRGLSRQPLSKHQLWGQ